MKKDGLNLPNKNVSKYGSIKNHHSMTANTLPYIHSLSIGDELINVSSSSLELFKEVKMILDDHFNKIVRFDDLPNLEQNEDQFSASVTNRNTQNTFWSSSKIKAISCFDPCSEEKNKDLKKSIPHAFSNRNILCWAKQTNDFKSDATGPKITYERSDLFNISKFPMASLLTHELDQILQKFPEIYRKSKKEVTEAL